MPEKGEEPFRSSDVGPFAVAEETPPAFPFGAFEDCAPAVVEAPALPLPLLPAVACDCFPSAAPFWRPTSANSSSIAKWKTSAASGRPIVDAP